MRLAARLISYAFHPLLFTTYLVLFFMWFIPRFLLIPLSSAWKFAGFIAAITFVFPVANLLMLKTFGSIPSLEMKERKQRILPFLMITVFYIVVCSMFYFKISAIVNFNKIMLISTSLALVATFVTFFFKISVHSMAVGGALGILLPLNKAADGVLLLPVACLLVIAGLVMSSRLYLQAHSSREIFYGAAAGFAVGFLGMILLF